MLDAFRGEGQTHAYLLNHDQARMAFPDLASLGTAYLLKKYKAVDENPVVTCTHS